MSPQLFGIFWQVIDCWENAVQHIVQREDLIATLEKFERAASDPNRFFEKGLLHHSLLFACKIRSMKVNSKYEWAQTKWMPHIDGLMKMLGYDSMIGCMGIDKNI